MGSSLLINPISLTHAIDVISLKNWVMSIESQQVLLHRHITLMEVIVFLIFLSFIGIFWVLNTFDPKDPHLDLNPSWRSGTPDPFSSSEEYISKKTITLELAQWINFIC